jgi:hypothetical protein
MTHDAAPAGCDAEYSRFRLSALAVVGSPAPDWQQERARRQERLMRMDIVRWTDHVAWALATTGESAELDRVRPLPKPTLLHMGGPALPWVFVLAMWLACVLYGWLCFAVMLSVPLHPWQQLPVVRGTSVAEGHALCAQTWARLPEEIPACCRRLTGVPCPVSER